MRVLLIVAEGIAGNVWANWMLVGSSVLSFMLLLLFRERYNRLSVDMQQGGAVNSDGEKAELEAKQ
jgi:hypothetical protein